MNAQPDHYLDAASRLGRQSTVLALVCHYRREQWLAQCIESLVRQTRPPDNIVVIDDTSPQPPVDIVRRFPNVTLLVARGNVGMYRLAQAVIASTNYDAYMFQDSDDWSAPDRLAAQLSAAESLGAEMVGCQERRIYEGLPPGPCTEHALDCNLGICINTEMYPILFSTSIISGGLIRRIGGLATGLRYSGDTEFIRRAVFVSRIINIPQPYYYRRIHPDAVTMHPDTGLKSPLRTSIHSRIKDRWDANCLRFMRGEELDLRPLAIETPIALDHAVGPELLSASASPSPRSQVGALSPGVHALMKTALNRAASVMEMYRRLVDRVRNRISETLPSGSVVAIVNKGDSALLISKDMTTLHFPSSADGTHTGYHPSDDGEAVRCLEEVRHCGAQFLVFPQTAFWWLDHYRGLRAHLDTHGMRVWGDEDCIIYRIDPAA
jgi:glycosyltransferase involved in cell wall biosynthesis